MLPNEGNIEELQALLHEGAEAKYAIAEILQHSDIPLQMRFADALHVIFSMRGLDVQKKGGIFLLDMQTDALHLSQTCGKFSAAFLRDEQHVPSWSVFVRTCSPVRQDTNFQ